MMSNDIHPAFLRDSEKKELTKNLPSPGQQVWVHTKQGEMKLATVSDPKMINSRVLDKITIPPNTLFTAWINENSEYIAVLKNEDWEWYDHPMDQPGPPAGSAGSMPFWRKPAKKIVDLKDVIQKEVAKQLDSNGHLERIKFQNEIIKKQKKEIKELKEMMVMERKCMQYELDDAEQEIETLNKENKEMTGSLVKVEWVIEQVKKVGGFTDTGMAVAEAFEYIDFPETSEVEKEDFVATSITNSVVQPSSTQEDREFYGGDFHEGSDEELDTISLRTSIEREEHEVEHRRNTTMSHRGQLQDVYDTIPPETTVDSIIQDIHDIYDLCETSQGNLVPRRLFFEEVENNEDQIVSTNSTSLPWYEERYPTPLEVQAIRTIQNYIRNNNE